VALRRDPEALFPGAAGGDTLELLIDTLLREVQRVGDGHHRLEGDEALRGRRRRTLGRGSGWRRNLHALRRIDGERTGRRGRRCRSTLTGAATTTTTATTSAAAATRGQRRGPGQHGLELRAE